MLTRLQAPPYDALAARLPPIGAAHPETATAVRAILDDVRARGDQAVREQTQRLDGVDLAPGEWEVPAIRCQEALARIPGRLRDALELAVERVRGYHEKQVERGFLERHADGSALGMRVAALDRVGVYVPGGKAAYPSTVIMNAVPAVVAGVREIVMVTPPVLPAPPAPPAGTPDVVLAAARLAGVTRVFRVGGAQAIAALAYGTVTIPRVDKIVGPGNRFVTEAKRQVAGHVGIDMLAGPTEVLIIADETADVRAVAADLIAQAEHDEDACAWCVTTSPALADALAAELARHVARSPRRAIVERALADHGVVVVVPHLDAAIEVVNRRAPEHVEVLVRTPWPVAERIRHAGAIFVGASTPEPVGDYVAGPSHVLPTAGTARYVSPLGVYDFVKRTSVIAYSAERLAQDAEHIIALAEAEGLHGHAEAIRVRQPLLRHPSSAKAAKRRITDNGPRMTTLPLDVQCTHRAPSRLESRRRMQLVLAIAAAVMIAEAIGGWVAHSLTLLADAGHMLADVVAIGLSLVVAYVAHRPVTAERTFGLLRLEILAALVNGAALIVISLGIALEAYHRFRTPQPVNGLLLIVVAAAGLAANAAAAAILHRGHDHSLNQRGAYLHILGDLLGSIGAVAAGAIILATGWLRADPVISILIAVLILGSAWRLVKESTDILLEAAPAHIALSDVHDRIASIPGVASVHDLHVWTVTSGVIAMSGHLVVQNPAENQRVLEAVQQRLGGMGIAHVTVQVERDQTCE
ncbi:MAG TPA: histidinol dehydrogenase [Gemmatimonadales bacterium]|nr:histidinol dehydrogenase [Gemmatimonadales bacterium]